MKVNVCRFWGAPREGSSPVPHYRASRAVRVGRGTIVALLFAGVVFVSSPAGAAMEHTNIRSIGGDLSICTDEWFDGTFHVVVNVRYDADGTIVSSTGHVMERGVTVDGVRYVAMFRGNLHRNGGTGSVRIVREGETLPNDDYIVKSWFHIFADGTTVSRYSSGCV